MIKIEQLQVGSIVEYNGMINDIVGIIPPKPDKSKRFNDVWAVELSIGIICPLADIKPIPLTENILTEWCGWEEMYRSSMHLTLEFEIKQGEWVNYYEWYDDDSKYIEFKGINFGDIALHQLQLLCFALTQTVLPIQIK